MDMGPTSGLRFHKGEPRKPTNQRTKRMAAMDTAEVRVYVFGRERNLCRCCRKRPAESMHELQFRSLGGKVSVKNSMAVCGDGTTGCHGFLQRNEITWEAHDKAARAEGTLSFFPLSPAAAEWVGLKRGERLESPVMQTTEIAS